MNGFKSVEQLYELIGSSMTYLSLLIYDCVPVNINVTGNPEANIILDKFDFLKVNYFNFHQTQMRILDYYRKKINPIKKPRANNIAQASAVNKGNNKITELRTILQRESQNGTGGRKTKA